MLYKEQREDVYTLDFSEGKIYTNLIMRLLNVDEKDVFEAQHLAYLLNKKNIPPQDVDFLPYDEIVKYTKKHGQ